MSERLKPTTDVPGQPRNIQNTRQIIDVLMRHTSFSGVDAGELLFGLDRLEAETQAEKVLKAPQVQDARAVVSSMLEKGFVPKGPADSFFTVLKDPETAKVLKQFVLPVPDQDSQVALKGTGSLKRDVSSVTKPDSQVTKQGIGRRRFLVGALALGGLAFFGIGVEAFNHHRNVIADYLISPPAGLHKKILDTPSIADELPEGWTQKGNYLLRRPSDNASVLRKFVGVGEISGVGMIVDGDSNTFYLGFQAFESSAEAQLSLGKRRNQSDWQSVNGIGDITWLDTVKTLGGVREIYYVVVDNVFVDIYAPDQDGLTMTKSTIKYLARLGVTPIAEGKK